MGGSERFSGSKTNRTFADFIVTTRIQIRAGESRPLQKEASRNFLKLLKKTVRQKFIQIYSNSKFYKKIYHHFFILTIKETKPIKIWYQLYPQDFVRLSYPHDKCVKVIQYFPAC